MSISLCLTPAGKTFHEKQGLKQRLLFQSVLMTVLKQSMQHDWAI